LFALGHYHLEVPAMIEQVRGVLEIAGGFIEHFAVGVIVIGFIWAVTKYYGALRSVGRVKAFPVFQADWGSFFFWALKSSSSRM
jgi:hypothetical protein